MRDYCLMYLKSQALFGICFGLCTVDKDILDKGEFTT